MKYLYLKNKGNINKMQVEFDTICALATPLGKGAISVIRVSGNRAIESCDKFFCSRKSLKEVKSKV